MKIFHFIIKNLKLNKIINLYLTIIIFILILQIIFWFQTENIKPNLSIIPNVPTLSTVKAMSFGDEEFYFRYKGLAIQNAGDTFGRFSPLKDYDYSKLVKWFELLDNLDSNSNYIPSLAAYYFAMTPKTEDLIYLINYLTNHADKKPTKRWWWYYQAIYLANSAYKNSNLAIEIAHKLKNSSPSNAPFWTKEMVAILLANKGDNCEAINIMYGIEEEYKNKNLSEEEMNSMSFFLKQRIEQLKKDKNFKIESCF